METDWIIYREALIQSSRERPTWMDKDSDATDTFKKIYSDLQI